MRVLIIPSWYFPAGTDSIRGRMFHQHATALIEHGVDARIWFPEYSMSGPVFKSESHEQEDGVYTYRARRWWLPKSNAMLFSWWISRACRDLQHHIVRHGKPDVIHAQSYQAAMAAAALHDKTGIPFVYTERLSNFFTRDIPKFHLDFFKPVFEKASAVTCVSPGLAEILEPHARASIRIIPNFVNTQVFYPDPAVTKRDAFTWIAVGEPAHTKGLDILLRAFALLKQKMAGKPMRLVLVDEIPEKKDLMTQATELGISDDIEWKGLIAQQQLAKLYNACHAYVSASRIETFGKATVEAQACGLPVVATKTAGSMFIVKQGHQGVLVELNDAASLANGMGQVMTGISEYDVTTLFETVKKRFDKAVVMRQWVELYENAMR